MVPEVWLCVEGGRMKCFDQGATVAEGLRVHVLAVLAKFRELETGVPSYLFFGTHV